MQGFLEFGCPDKDIPPDCADLSRIAKSEMHKVERSPIKVYKKSLRKAYGLNQLQHVDDYPTIKKR